MNGVSHTCQDEGPLSRYHCSLEFFFTSMTPTNLEGQLNWKVFDWRYDLSIRHWLSATLICPEPLLKFTEPGQHFCWSIGFDFVIQGPFLKTNLIVTLKKTQCSRNKMHVFILYFVTAISIGFNVLI